MLFLMLFPSDFFSPLRKGWEEIAFTVGVEFTCNNLGVRRERK